MSSEIAIEVRNLSKVYHIYDRPADRLRQMLMRGRKQYFREFWALRDISFDVKRGETVGIIGHNGSGKSTLLQLIAGTLTPTNGQVNTVGKVAALLELGSGFNPEFTGRENVALYGQILGMSEGQIRERFPAIVEFSEIGDFIDQPLKTYSSGMYVRLAFSVAIHVDPDILIVDEALSVGDAFFQAKCMTVMKKLMDAGTTLLFVSHDPGAVKTLCSRAVLLDHGVCEAIGQTDEVVEAYYAKFVKRRQSVRAHEPSRLVGGPTTIEDDEVMFGAEEFQQRASFQRLQNGKASFVNVQILDENGHPATEIVYSSRVTLKMVVSVSEDLPVLSVGYHIRDKNGFDVAYSDTGIEDSHLYDVRAGDVHVFDWQFNVPLRAGEYSVSAVMAVPLDLTIGSVETCDHVPIAALLRIVRGQHLPLYGAVHLDNQVRATKFVQTHEA